MRHLWKDMSQVKLKDGTGAIELGPQLQARSGISNELGERKQSALGAAFVLP